ASFLGSGRTSAALRTGTALGTVVIETTLAVAAVAVEATVAVEAALTVAVAAVAAGTVGTLLEVLGVQGAGGGAQGLSEHLALVDPHLHADAAVGGGSLSEAVVDVGAQSLQGDGAVVIVLGTGDLSAAQTA